MNKNERIFIHESLWSKTYRVGNYLEKEYKQLVVNAVEREIDNSLLAYKNSILTPYCYGYRVENGILISKFDYWEMNKINLALKINEVLQLTENLQRLPFSINDTYWDRHIVPEQINALAYLDFDTTHFKQFLVSLSKSSFIHGDLACTNIGLFENRIAVFDFQHACYGPRNWDLAYLIASCMEKSQLTIHLPQYIEKMIQLVSAIRVGRAIRKGSSELDVRIRIFNSWNN